MRAWFLLLLAANLAFFAWTQYLSPADRGRDPAPLQRQIDPGKLKVVPPAGPGGVPSGGRKTAARACLEWGSFSAAESARAEGLLAPLGLGTRLTPRRDEETAHWWVFLPSQGSRQAALRKLDELKSLGVEEHFVMQDDARWRWAISLGVFRSEDAAKARLESLKEKKVRGARLGERETQVTRVWYQLRDPDAELESRLRELAQAFPATELRDCPAAQ